MNLLTQNHVLLICSVLFVLMLASCSATPGTRENRAAAPPPPKVAIDGPVYTEITKNKVVYSGTAESAEYFDSTHPGIVMHPDVQGVLTNAETFSVSSDRGYYDESRHLITLNDNIHALLNDTYTLTCSTIDYFMEKKLLVSDDPITVVSSDIQLHGDKGRIDLEKNRMTVLGNIHAKIYNMSLK